MKKELKKKSLHFEDSKINHDELFKTGFSDVSMALELMPLIFSKKEMDFYNWQELQSEKDSFENQKIADLIFSVPSKEGGLSSRICILLEHKSRFKPRLFEQLLDYQYLMAKAGFQGKNPQALIPVVFYHGKQAWKWKLSYQDWLESYYSLKIPLSLRKNMLNYEIRLIEARSPEIDRLLKEKDTQSRIFLYLLREVWDLKLKLKDVHGLLGMVKSLKEEKRYLILSVKSYIKKYGKGEVDKVLGKLENIGIKTGIFKKGGYMGVEERIKQLGIEEGLEKGFQISREEIVLNMLKEQVEIAFISKITGLSKKKILEIKESS